MDDRVKQLGTWNIEHSPECFVNGRDSFEGTYVIYAGKDYRRIARTIRGLKNDSGEEEMNARLISAAPDLLEAVEEILCNPGDSSAMELLLTAYNKATKEN